MTSPRILLIDPDATQAQTLCDGLRVAGCVAQWHDTPQAALQMMAQGWSPDLVFLSGAEVGQINRLHAIQPGLPVVVVAQNASVQAAVQAVQAGAADYLSAPLDMAEALARIRQFVPAAATLPMPGAAPARPQPAAPVKHAQQGLGTDSLVAESPAMRAILDIARRAAQTDVTVMLLGESGVGKEVMARFIHAQSPRAAGPFIAINCAAIPETLLEATLFGFEKGAFTGAGQSAPGKFEQAQGGTLLLDEVTEMAPSLQAKLLRVLQEREIERLGGRRRIVLDLRLIATSNRDLQQAVKQGVLREDVYYRLSVFPLQIPPLRQRRDDILPLAQAMLARHAAQFRLPSVPQLDAAACQSLLAHDWPGNVRELDNVMQRASILCQGGRIGVGDLLFAPPPSKAESQAAPAALPTAAPQGDLGTELALSERQLIAAALQQSQGSKSLAAQRLGISPRTLRHKLQKLREAGLGLPDAS
ncbi:MAG: sigma 54-interacting transcriptional regulator [Thiomonas sp.]